MPAKAPTSFLLSRTAGVKAMGPCRNRPYVPHFCVRLVWPRSAHSRACMLGMATLSDQSVRSPFKCALLPLRISCAAASAFRRQLAGTVLPRLVRSDDYVGYSGSEGSEFDPRHQPVDASVEWPAKHSTVRPSQPWVQCVLSGPTPKSARPVHRCFRCFVQHVVWPSAASVLLHRGACGLCSSPCAILRAGLLLTQCPI